MEPVTCPGCGQPIPEPQLVPGTRLECEHCAGLTLEVIDEGGKPVLRQVYRVSCPLCDEQIEVPRNAKPGQEVNHCGRTFRLTYEFGAYALE